jgi:hypothetical protein
MQYTFDENTTTPLCEIMGKYGSDKGNVNIAQCWHNYTTFYHSIFKEMQQSPLRIFELGLGTNNLSVPSNMGANGKPGASLYGWREFFPNSKIYGADIDMNILFESDRIKTYYCDQTNPVIIKMMWNQTELVDGFDIIVEDGLHEYHANECFFENSVHKLNAGGYFIIEDILHYELHLFQNKIGEWKLRFPELEFTLLCIPSKRNTFDNNLLVIKKNK